MKRRLLFFALVLAASVTAQAADSSDADNTENEFAGKIVAVQLSQQAHVFLANVSIVKCGGESFLAGTVFANNESVHAAEDWWQGLHVRLNLRFVVSYAVMTPQEFKTRAQNARKY